MGAAVSSFVLAASCSPAPKSPGAGANGPPNSGIRGSTGRFVGSAACRECHADVYAAWSGSRHSSTLRPWAEGQPLRLAERTMPAPYRMSKDGTVAGPGADRKELQARVAFLVGGRHREEALVHLPDGRIQVFPIALDADSGTAFEPLREVAGGTPPPSDVVEFWTRAGRNADLACYGCHATGQTLRVVGQSPAGLVLPGSSWVEPGVGCEACHGPGGPHVDDARSGAAAPRAIAMTRGDAAGMVDACAACHGLRDVLPSPFGEIPAHRYGEPIAAAADPLLTIGSNSEFRNPFFADLRPSTYQQEAIAFSQSGCARSGRMTCATCHDVHSGAPSAKLQGGDGGDSICAPCHAAIVASASKHALHPVGSPGGRCLDCHMARIVRGPGREAARDHSMAPPIAGPDEIPAACAACHAGASNAARVIGAWKVRPKGAALARRLEIVDAIDASAASRPEAALALARLAGDSERGWFIRWAALQTLALDRARSIPAPAQETLREALSDPNPALRRAAARALGQHGTAKDVPVLLRATDDSDPWAALEAAHGMGLLGAPSAGGRLLQLMKRPDLVTDARAQYLYGHACLVGQDAPHAETALRRALELNPMMVGAINDLGLALIAQNRREPAIAAWKLALAINPRSTAAQRNLEAAKP